MSLGDDLLDDLDVFFNVDDFAVAATIGAATVNGILDDEYIEDLDVAGTRPIFICKTSDVAAVSQGATVVIGAVSYTVVVKQQDGTGVTRLVLEEV